VPPERPVFWASALAAEMVAAVGQSEHHIAARGTGETQIDLHVRVLTTNEAEHELEGCALVSRNSAI
jgi:hypothetical protein